MRGDQNCLRIMSLIGPPMLLYLNLFSKMPVLNCTIQVDQAKIAALLNAKEKDRQNKEEEERRRKQNLLQKRMEQDQCLKTFILIS